MSKTAPDTAPAQGPCDSCAGSVRAMAELTYALTTAQGGEPTNSEHHNLLTHLISIATYSCSSCLGGTRWRED